MSMNAATVLQHGAPQGPRHLSLQEMLMTSQTDQHLLTECTHIS